MAHEIKSIRAGWILDSRGNPTVECEVRTRRFCAKASVPSGASRGVHEALELRDGGKEFHGMHVTKAVHNINLRIAKRLNGSDVTMQRGLDRAMVELDGTKNKSVLGANATLAVSLACARAAALEKGMPLYRYIALLAGNRNCVLPVPAANIINGGVHAGSGLDLQEFMVVPVGAKNFAQAAMACSEVYHKLREMLIDRYGKGAVNVGDEGGFAPPVKSTREPLGILVSAIREAGHEGKVRIALDAAASEFFDESRNRYYFEGGKLNGGQMMRFYEELCASYPIISIEDPFAQDDWGSYAEFSRKFRRKVQIVGDDLLVTDVERIREALKLRAVSAVLLKPNQAGTLSEALDAAKFALGNNLGVMVSHRSGETEDSFISDLAVGLGCGQIKLGAPCRGERTAKYNRLLGIEREMKKPAYAGGKFFRYLR